MHELSLNRRVPGRSAHGHKLDGRGRGVNSATPSGIPAHPAYSLVVSIASIKKSASGEKITHVGCIAGSEASYAAFRADAGLDRMKGACSL